jgi:hypothetical protein
MTAQHDPELGVDYVAVDDEPNHVEKFRSGGVRLYEATIPPGRATEFHRHDRDTLYVILAGGRFRSDEPGQQHAGTRLGRSVTRPRQLRWLVRRALTGWLTMPTGTLLVQPHAAHPLIHRVIAAATNPLAIRMFGIEMHNAVHLSTRAGLRGDGIHVEYLDPRYTVYRLHLAPDGRRPVALPNGGVLVAVAGTADVADGRAVTDAVTWLDPGTPTIRSTAPEPLKALLVAL